MVIRRLDYEGDSSIPNGLHELCFLSCECDRCGKEIEDSFYSYDGTDEQYCVVCFINEYATEIRLTAVCNDCGCGDKRRGLVKINGVYLCEDCMDNRYKYFLDDYDGIG